MKRYLQMSVVLLLLFIVVTQPVQAETPKYPSQSFPVGARIAGPPEYAEALSYVSNNKNVAVINSRGQIGVVGAGEAMLKAFDSQGTLVMVLPLSIPKPDAATLARQKAIKGDYKLGSVYGPRLPQKQLDQLRARIEFILRNYLPDSSSMSDADKIISVLSILTENCSYATTWSKNYANTAWGSLVYGEGQCSAYARGFKALADAIDLSCYYVRGSKGPKEGRHQWVMVKCEDKWFHLEPQQMFNGQQIKVSKQGLRTAFGEGRDSVPVTYLRCKYHPYENASKLPQIHNENYVIGVTSDGDTFIKRIDEQMKLNLPLDPTMW
ncbi:transglutaminase domain-containing protein [uncultured Cloacibacillus sp.]|uniref:transglutaminase domain-containing protein n=1 Tax=uncultured Cloacibacillus sp. TaxID=889794 RepID=UPI0026225BEF|nr:transglutaminase domain-containing protein [uncultured Cloacibacillus sp.]